MKSNNVDSGSRGTTVDAALQCQHTSINNLIKSPVVTTLFQLPSFSQTRWIHSQRNPHSASSLHVVQCGLCPTGGCREFLSYCPLLSSQLLISDVPLCLYTFFIRFPLIEVAKNPPTHHGNKIRWLDPYTGHIGLIPISFCLCLSHHFHQILFSAVVRGRLIGRWM